MNFKYPKNVCRHCFVPSSVYCAQQHRHPCHLLIYEIQIALSSSEGPAFSDFSAAAFTNRLVVQLDLAASNFNRSASSYSFWFKFCLKLFGVKSFSFGFICPPSFWTTFLFFSINSRSKMRCFGSLSFFF